MPATLALYSCTGRTASICRRIAENTCRDETVSSQCDGKRRKQTHEFLFVGQTLQHRQQPSPCVLDLDNANRWGTATKLKTTTPPKTGGGSHRHRRVAETTFPSPLTITGCFHGMIGIRPACRFVGRLAWIWWQRRRGCERQSTAQNISLPPRGFHAR